MSGTTTPISPYHCHSACKSGGILLQTSFEPVLSSINQSYIYVTL